MKSARVLESADIGKLILDLETLLGKTEQDVLETKKEITRAQRRVGAFEKLSRDPQFGKYYSQYLRLSRDELRAAEKRKERLGRQLRDVNALLQRATELAEFSNGERSR